MKSVESSAGTAPVVCLMQSGALSIIAGMRPPRRSDRLYSLRLRVGSSHQLLGSLTLDVLSWGSGHSIGLDHVILAHRELGHVDVVSVLGRVEPVELHLGRHAQQVELL